MKPGMARPFPAHSGRRPDSHDERWLARIWEQQAFDRANLRTTSGVAFKVVFPGLSTGEAGPDFRDAILALPDGSLLRGDVEVHLESSGWRRHGHHRDPAYDQVLLHVVLGEDEAVHTSRAEPLLTLELAGRLKPRPMTASQRMQGSAQLTYVVAPCRQALKSAGPERVGSALTRLALARFGEKQARFEDDLAHSAPEQALYAGLMEALGYSRNQEPFRHLARAVPLSDCLAASSSEIEARLMAAAELDRAPHAAAAWRWRLTGVRPGNLPAQRITQFAAILSRLGAAQLLPALLAPLREAGAGPPPPAAVHSARRAWRGLLAEVGPQRADAMVVNVVLPFAAAYGQTCGVFDLSEAAAQLFLAYPGQGANRITRYMRRDILGPLATAAQGAAGEQALQHVWSQWCHEKICALCPLGGNAARSR